MKMIDKTKTVFYIYLISLIVIFVVGFIFVARYTEVSLPFFIRSLILILPFSIAFLILFFFHDRLVEKIQPSISFENSKFKAPLLYLIFTILYLISVLYLNFVDEKGFFYIIILTVLYFVILIQITMEHINSSLILLEIILTYISSVFSQTLRYPYYFGQLDIFHHTDWATIILYTGRLLPSDLNSGYIYYPIFHLIFVIGTILLNLPLLTSYFIIAGIAFTLSILFFFCFNKLIFDKKIALIACLFYATTNTIVLAGIFMIPYILAFVFFILLLFLIVRINKKFSNIHLFLLLIILVIGTLVSTHHASMIQISGIFIIFSILILFLHFFRMDDDDKFNFFPFVLFFIAFIVYWFYAARPTSNAMEYLLKDFFANTDPNSLNIQSVNLQQHISGLDGVIIFIVNHLPYGILLFFIIFGIGLVFRQKFQKFLWVFAIFALLSLPLWMPVGLNYLAIFEKFTGVRLVIFTSPFILSIFAYSFYFTLNYQFKKFKKVVVSLVLVLFILYSFLLLINIPNYDFRFNSGETVYTSYLNQKDLAAINFFDQNTKNDVVIISDLLISSYFRQKTSSSVRINLGLHSYQTEIMKKNGPNSDIGDYIFYRKGEFQKTHILLLKDNPVNYVDHIILEKTFVDSNKIYSNRDNEIYYN